MFVNPRQWMQSGSKFWYKLNIWHVMPAACLIVCLGLFLLCFVAFFEGRLIFGFSKKNQLFINFGCLVVFVWFFHDKTCAFNKKHVSQTGPISINAYVLERYVMFLYA